jgi:methyl-accepting chemotaxis protein
MKSLLAHRMAVVFYLLLAAAAGAAVVSVHMMTGFKLEAAFDEYQSAIHDETVKTQTKVEDSFKQIYQNIRTISLLPTVRSIDREGTSLTDGDRETIKQIYFNAYSDIHVSEIYIVPASFNPTAIDPATGKTEAPAASFDSEVASTTGDAVQGAPQVEDEEYKLLTEQIQLLQKSNSTSDTIKGLNVPLVSGHEVITCDNTDFDTTHVDADRKGVVFSVPYYDASGKFAGVVAAITRTKVLRGLLPDRNLALVSPAYGYILTSTEPGQAGHSPSAVASGVADQSLKMSEVMPVSTADSTAGWVVWNGRADSEFTDLPNVRTILESEQTSYAVIAILAVLAGVAFTYFYVRFYRPIQRLTDSMMRLAAGDMVEDAPVSSRQDFIGKVSRTLNSFGANLRQAKTDETSRKYVINSLAKGLDQIKSGNLSQGINDPFPQEMEELRQAFNETVRHLQEIISSVKNGATSVKTASHEIAEASDELSKRTESQAASLEETAAAIAEITSSVRKTAEGAKQARNVAARAKDDADHCNDVLAQTTVAMKDIETSSQHIVQIIGAIDEIAFQTNLLALNAGVEAARAGDVGRGFAVVASEVRALATRSAEAAKEIKELISNSRDKVQKGTVLVAETSKALSEIVGRVTEINTVIADIASSAAHQSATLDEVNPAINQIDQVTQKNAAMSEETNATAHTLVQEFDELNTIVDRFVTLAA